MKEDVCRKYLLLLIWTVPVIELSGISHYCYLYFMCINITLIFISCFSFTVGTNKVVLIHILITTGTSINKFSVKYIKRMFSDIDSYATIDVSTATSTKYVCGFGNMYSVSLYTSNCWKILQCYLPRPYWPIASVDLDPRVARVQ